MSKLAVVSSRKSKKFSVTAITGDWTSAGVSNCWDDLFLENLGLSGAPLPIEPRRRLREPLRPGLAALWKGGGGGVAGGNSNKIALHFFNIIMIAEPLLSRGGVGAGLAL